MDRRQRVEKSKVKREKAKGKSAKMDLGRAGLRGGSGYSVWWDLGIGPGRGRL